MPRQRRNHALWWLWTAVVLLLGACRGVPAVGGSLPPTPGGTLATTTETALPTLSPTPVQASPTPTALRWTVTPRPSPTWPAPPTVTPVGTVPWPTYTPTPIQEPWEGTIPYARVQILRPAVESMEVSPIDFYAQVYRKVTPAIVHIELWSQWEDEPRLLYRKVVRLYEPRDPRVRFLLLREEIPFEIRPAQAWGRLQVLVRDTRGLPVTQQAVYLVLQRYGVDVPQVEQQLRTAIAVAQPAEGAVLPREGVLELQGLARYTTGLMEVLLYSRDGRILQATTVPLGPPDPRGYAPFAYTWPYRFPQGFAARLVFQLYDPRVQGVAYLESVDLRFR